MAGVVHITGSTNVRQHVVVAVFVRTNHRREVVSNYIHLQFDGDPSIFYCILEVLLYF